MKEIPLTQGQVALVDDADFDWLSRYKWRVFWDQHTKSFYARSTCKETGRTLRMHRMILGLAFGDKRHGEHGDKNTLNNQRSNLRIATVFQNNQNRGLMHSNTSGYKNVSWTPKTQTWMVQMMANGVRGFYGNFKNKEDAIRRADEVRRQLHGEFARAA